MNIHFAQPWWLAAGLVLCLGAMLFLWISGRKREESLQHFVAPHLLGRLTCNVSPVRRMIKNILVILGLACCFIALARPQYGSRWVEVKQKGIDILLAVDTSKSMMARDVRPNRLERAKLAIKDFVGRLDGDRVGLLPFAGSSFLMCPLTTDYEAVNSSLDAMDTSIIPKGGTDLAGAIKAAQSVLSNEANNKILILVTDGENLQGDALKAANEAKKQKMIIYTVGVGTPEGELIPIPGRGKGKFLQDNSGRFVTSKLDESMLTRIAETTGGIYVPLGNMGQGFDTIYQQKLMLVPKEEHDGRLRKLPIERFMWPLAAAILLLAFEFILSGRKPSWSFRIPFIKTAGRRKRRALAAVMVILVLKGLQPVSGCASEGEQHFAAGDFDKASNYYNKVLKKKPNDPRLYFNLGDADYKRGQFGKAISSFNQALKSDDLGLQAKSYYNRGNAQYQIGLQTLKNDPQHTIEMWREARKSFENSLALAPKDKDARYNLDVVKKRLTELKKQQKQQQKKLQESQQKKKRERKKSDNKQRNNQTEKREQQADGQSASDKMKNQRKPGKDRQAPQKNNRAQKKAGNEKDKHMQQNGEKKQDGLQKNKRKKQAVQTGRKTAMTEKDKKRRLQGKMTAREAENLLNALKSEEGKLNFVPQGIGNGNDQPERNW